MLADGWTWALEILSRSSVDVALVDLRLGSEDRTVLIREVRTGWPETAVLVVSGASDADNVSRAMDSGCHGYLLKGQPMHELIAGIEAVARGERAFAPDVREFVRVVAICRRCRHARSSCCVCS